MKKILRAIIALITVVAVTKAIKKRENRLDYLKDKRMARIVNTLNIDAKKRAVSYLSY